jgi:hypothetical protein
VRGAGNETTETKIGTEIEKETAIHAARAAAPAVLQDGVVPTRGDQVCNAHVNIYILLSSYRMNGIIIIIIFDADRRDYGRDREDDRRDKDSRESRRRDERDRRDAGRRDGEKDRGRYDRDRRESDKGRDAERDDDERAGERKARVDSEPQDTRKSPSQSQGSTTYVFPPLDVSKTDRYRCVCARPSIAQSSTAASQKVIHTQVDADAGEPEEGEAMEALNDDDEDMMAMMGMAGFGSTKVLISLYICGRVFSY